MPDTLFLLFCLFDSLLHSNAGWTSPKSTLIRNDTSFAVGAYNDSIFLVGGVNYKRQITEYRIDTDTFIDIGETVLTSDVYGYAQFCVQKGEILYMIEPSLPSEPVSALSTFNMKNRQYTANWTDIDVDVDSYGCLAVSNDHLYVVGGQNKDILQIMDLVTYEWMVNTSSMNEARGFHACIVYYEHLWVFGGYVTNYLESNEHIKITDIESNKWVYIEPLTVGISDLRAAAWMQNIFLIGGEADSFFIDTVHVVDVTTGEVTLSPDRLLYPIGYTGIVLTNNVIYVFGGTDDDFDYELYSTNKWMQYILETDNITTSNAPSTQISSITPSQYPTTNPTTDISSQTPTALQSITPSQYPSTNPISSQTLNHTTNAPFLSTQYLSSISNNTLTETERATLNTPTIYDPVLNILTDVMDDAWIPSNNSSHMILYIAASIAVCCVCCLCILLIWKGITQKQWNPEPHDTAGDLSQRDAPYLDVEEDENQVQLQEHGGQMVQIKRVNSISLVRTIEGPQNVLNDKQLEIEDNVEGQVAPNNVTEGVQYEETNGTKETTNTKTHR